MKTHEELPPCAICGEPAPFFADNKNLCYPHWLQSPHYQQLAAERLKEANDDK